MPETDKKDPDRKVLVPPPAGTTMPIPSQELRTLIVRGDEPLGITDAEAIVAQRIIDALPEEAWDAMNFGRNTVLGFDTGTRLNEDLAQVIIGSLPEEYRTTTVLASMDLRPYFEALDGKKLHGERLDKSFTNLFGELGALKDVEYTVDTKVFIEAETERIKAAIGTTDPNQPDPTEYDSRQVGVVPTSESVAPSPGAGAAAAANATGMIDTDDDGIPDTFNPTSISATGKFPIDDMRQTVEMRIGDLDALARADAEHQEEFPGQYFPIQLDYPKPKQQAGPSTMTIPNAITYLSTLTPDKVAQMQEKLAAGGYFDMLGNDGHYLKGDAYDQNTVDAWKLLLTDSVKQNKPMPQVLGKKIKTYREQVRESRLRNMSKFDPSYSMALANDFAQSKLGRNLSTDELEGLNVYLERLRTARAGDIPGTNDNTRALPNAEGFDGGDVEMYLGVKTEREQRIDNANTTRFQLAKAMK